MSGAPDWGAPGWGGAVGWFMSPSSRRAGGPSTWRAPEDLRRTLYLLAIALGMVVVLFLNLLAYRAGA